MAQDLFDGINNDALLIEDCNNNPMPHHWLGDGYCDDGSDIEDGGGDCKHTECLGSADGKIAAQLTAPRARGTRPLR